MSALAKEHTTIEVAGREVRLSSPSKVFFPKGRSGKEGFTKLDLAEYYMAVADAAAATIARAAGDDEALRGRRHGRISSSRSGFRRMPPSGFRPRPSPSPSGRTATELVATTRRTWSGRSTSAWSTSTPTPCGDPTLTAPTSCRWTSTRSRGCAGTPSARSRCASRRSWRTTAWSDSRRPQGAGASTSTCGQARVGLRRGPPRGARPRPRGRAAGAEEGHQQVVEGGAPWRLRRLQPERARPHHRLRLLGPPRSRRQGLLSDQLEGGSRRRARRPAPGHGSRPDQAEGDPAAEIDEHAGSLDKLLDLARRDEEEGLGDAPAAPLPQAARRGAAASSRRRRRSQRPQGSARNRQRRRPRSRPEGAGQGFLRLRGSVCALIQQEPPDGW